MRDGTRVESVLPADLYQSWQTYLLATRRTSQKEIRFLIAQAIAKWTVETGGTSAEPRTLVYSMQPEDK